MEAEAKQTRKEVAALRREVEHLRGELEARGNGGIEQSQDT